MKTISLNLNFFLLFLCLVNFPLKGQVLNFNFETYSTCPIGFSTPYYDEIALATNWDWASNGTSDYFNACWSSGPSSVDVSDNFAGSQSAYSGNGYGGIYALITSDADYREYLQGKFTTSLTAGVTYKIQLRISLADCSGKAIKDFGISFTPSLYFEGTDDILSLTYTPLGNSVVSDYTNWTTLTGCFTASGGENYFQFGNFKNNASTTYSNVSTGYSTGCGLIDPSNSAYYYIDDVVFTPVSSPVISSPNSSICPGSSTLLTATTGFATYQWYLNAAVIPGATNSTYLASGAGTYTVIVSITGGCTFNSNSYVITVCSNPIPIITGDQYSCNTQSQYLVSNCPVGTTFQWSFTGNGGSGNINSSGLVTWNGSQGGTVCVISTTPCGCTSSNCYTVLSCCSGDGAISSCNKKVVQNITSSAFEALLVGNGCDGIAFDNIPSPGSIGGSSDFNHEFVINGTLTLDGDLTLINIPNLHFGKDAKIYNNGFLLTINNCGLKAGCNEMWTGIEGHNTISTLSVLNSSIQDAKFAVAAYNRPSIRVIGNDFDLNLECIYVRDLSGNPLTYSAVIQGNTFDCTSNLLSPYSTEKTWRGIDLLYITGPFPIGVNNAPNNVFKNLNVGIYGYAATITITKENVFQNFLNNISSAYTIPKGYAVYTLGVGGSYSLSQAGLGNLITSTKTFDNCTYGIYVNNMTMDIQNNFMSDVTYGITSINGLSKTINISNNRIYTNIVGTGISISKGIDLNANAGSTISIQANLLKVCPTSTFNSSSAGIDFFDNNSSNPNVLIKDNGISVHYAGKGIHINGANGAYVINNSIYLVKNGTVYGIGAENSNNLFLQCNNINPSTATSLSNKEGISLSYTTNSLLECNTVNYTDNGLAFRNSSGGNTLQANNFYNHNHALHLSSGANIGTQTDKGNKWNINLTGSQYGAYASGVSAANFDAPSTIVYTPSNIVGNIQFFTSTNTQANCNSINCSLVPQPLKVAGEDTSIGLSETILSELDSMIATGDLNYCAGDSQVAWMNETYLYEKIHTDTLLLSQNEVAINFYLNASNTSIKEFRDIQDSIDAANRIFTVNTDALENFIPTLENLKMVYITNLEVIQDSTASINVLDSLSQINDTILPEMYKLQSFIDSIYSLTDSLFKVKMVSILESNQTVEDIDELHEQNQKIVNQIYLDYTSFGIDSLSEDQMSQLTQIANQCPFSGGPSVLTARSIIGIYDFNSSYNDEEICGNEDNGKISTSLSTLMVKIYPNPTSGELSVNYSLQNSEKYYLIISNLLGQEIVKRELLSQNGVINLDISEFSTGVYLLSLVSAEKVAYRGRFTKI